MSAGETSTRTIAIAVPADLPAPLEKFVRDLAETIARDLCAHEIELRHALVTIEGPRS